MDLIVFKNVTNSEEYIVVPCCDFENVYRLFFVEGGRNIEDFEVFAVDGSQGFAIRIEMQSWENERRDVVIEPDGKAWIMERPMTEDEFSSFSDQ